MLLVWQASEASKTLSEVTQSTIDDISLLACLEVHMGLLYP